MFSITIADLKQIYLRKIKRYQILMEINKYKRLNMHTLQSQIQDSVENKEKHEETQSQANHKSRKASAPVFAAPDPSTGPKTPTEEILPIPIW